MFHYCNIIQNMSVSSQPWVKVESVCSTSMHTYYFAHLVYIHMHGQINMVVLRMHTRRDAADGQKIFKKLTYSVL